uniref:Uncharacterized protein n=1 Tax=Callithrix jacchus TaxID=9483 RepID=A0A2R8MNT2_CALJA
VSAWRTQQQQRDAPSKVFLCQRFFMPEKTMVLPGKTQRV